MSDAPASKVPRLLAGLLALVLAVIYWQVRTHDFTNYDDPDYVSNNRLVQEGLTRASVRWAFDNPYAWHPLTWLSHALDVQLFGLNPGPHHLVSVALHIATALLLFYTLLRVTRAPWRCVCVAGLFALHPLRVESVAWIAERKDVLSGFFWMLTLWTYVRYAEKPGWARYLGVATSFALGLMAKPMLVTLPFVLLLLDYWPLRRIGPAGSGGMAWPRRVLEKLPLLGLSAATCIVTLYYLKMWGPLDMEMHSGPARAANALVSCVRYLGKTILPEDLAVVYPHPGSWPAWAVGGSCGLLLLITAIAFLTSRSRPYVIVGWLWFLGALVPVLGLVQVNVAAMADRYTYLPSIGLCLAVVWALSDAQVLRPAGRKVLVVTAVLALAGCALLTWRQLGYWRDSVTLFTHAVNVTSDNALARYNLGQAMSERVQALENARQIGRARQWVEAGLPHYEEAVRIRPRYADAHNNLGLTLAKLGRVAEATNHYALALQANPRHELAPFNMAVALAGLGQHEQAIPYFEAVLSAEAGQAQAHFYYGKTLETLGRIDDAARHYADAARYRRGGYLEAEILLGNLHFAAGRLDEAIARYTEAVRLEPRAAEARAQLGIALAARGRAGEAAGHYRASLEQKPDQPEVLNNLAWLLATHSDAAVRSGAEAVRLAARACDLTRRAQPLFLGTLAAAYAEDGRFDQAMQTAREARDVARALGQTELAETNEKLLRRYGLGKPYRDGEDP